MVKKTQENKIGHGKAGPGRPKGKPNKVTKELKEAILHAFDEVGGSTYLTKVAQENPQTFCTLLGKVLPLQVTGENGGPLTIEVVRFANTASE